MDKNSMLFCFPYAGGAQDIFFKWKTLLRSDIKMIPIELAGRGSRLRDGFYSDMKHAVEDVYGIVSKEIKKFQLPYAFFGHSMGCKIAYDLAQKIQATDLMRPEHLFFSGRLAPHVKNELKKIYHLMDDSEFEKEVIALGGTPPELFHHKELIELFLPILKNDFKIVETDNLTNVIKPLDVDISVFLGKEDHITDEGSNGWHKHTLKSCMIHYFEGGHFFLNNKTEELTHLINTSLV